MNIPVYAQAGCHSFFLDRRWDLITIILSAGKYLTIFFFFFLLKAQHKRNLTVLFLLILLVHPPFCNWPFLYSLPRPTPDSANR